MNKTIIYLFLLLFMNVAANSQVQSYDAIYLLEQKAHEKQYAFEGHQLSNGFNITYHKLEWQVDPAVNYINGAVTTHFEVIDDRLNCICFDLSNALNVDSVCYKSQKVPFSHEQNLLNINLKDTLLKGSIDTIQVYYQGRPDQSGFGSFITSTHHDSPILWTLSEPYGAKDWWPCKQILTDKIDSIDLFITVPVGNKAASNGLLQSSKIKENSITHHWKHNYPIAYYLIAMAVTNYEEFTHFAMINEQDSLPILNYVYPEYLNRYVDEAKYTIDLIELYSERFIPYPFAKEKYGHAQFGWGGGMEHQTMSFMSNFSQHLIAHELTHQWFGNHVTCGSWQDIWVNEGFAVFGEAIAQEYLHPEDWPNWIEDRMDHVAANAQEGSVFVADTNNLKRLFDNTLTYQKGGMVLHQLRHQIGDDAFFGGIKLMLSTSEKNGHTAKTSDVQHYFEQAADTNLSAYFQDWIYGEGLPKFNVSIKQENDFSTTITLNQKPSSEKTLFFALKVPMLLKTDNGDTLVIMHQTINHQSFTYQLRDRVKHAVLDPHYTLITAHPATIQFDIDIIIEEERVLIAPNPAHANLNISWSEQLLVEKFEIYSAKGKRVHKDTLTEAVHNYQIPIHKLKSGSYILKTYAHNEVIVKKFIKE